MNYNDRAAAATIHENRVGQITKIYGTNGELVVKLWDNFPQSIINSNFKEPLWVEIDTIATPIFLCSFKNQGASKAIVAFEDFSNEQLSAMLVGMDIYAEIVEITDNSVGSDLSYLENFSFLDITSSRSGVVRAVIDNKLNPLLEVDFEDRQGVLVPIAEPLIEKLSRRKRTIVMRLAVGFHDLSD